MKESVAPAREGMRIDKYLFFVRLLKSRNLAQRLIEEGHLRIDSRPIDRAHTEVRPGSVLTFILDEQVRVMRIEALPTRRGPASEARTCYTDLSPPVDRQGYAPYARPRP